MKKIMAVIIVCAAVALFTVCLVFGGDKEMNTYGHGRTLLSAEDMEHRADPGVFDLLYEYACTEEGADRKLTDYELEYFDIDSDGEGVAIRAEGDFYGMSQVSYNMYFTEDSGKTWELHESALHLISGIKDFVFADGKLVVFNLNDFDYTSGVTVYDSKKREFTEYSGKELIDRSGFSECGVTKLRLCANVLYKNAKDNTVVVGWAYRSQDFYSRPKSNYILIAEYTPDFDLVNVLSVDRDLVRIYKITQDVAYCFVEALLITDRELTEDDICDVMKLECLDINPGNVISGAIKFYEKQEDKTETDLYNYKFLSGLKVDGGSFYFSVPE